MKNTIDLDSTISILADYKQKKKNNLGNQMINELIIEIMYYDLESVFKSFARMQFSKMSPFWEELGNTYDTLHIKSFYSELKFMNNFKDKKYLKRIRKSMQKIIRKESDNHPDLYKSLTLLSIDATLNNSLRKKCLIDSLKQEGKSFDYVIDNKDLLRSPKKENRKKRSEEYFKRAEGLELQRRDEELYKPHTSIGKVFDDIHRPSPIDKTTYNQMADKPFKKKNK